ncbi:hypothetical protein [Stigmatella hybrida]|uniref:hypothetical protein n=1 Tax=Stigmatella hybrida TaxID=394097 RepID=UPI001CDA7B02|nr:hypothetical protein [Stigmatella hybrida]
MNRRRSLGEILWPEDEESLRLAVAWADSIAEQALELVWRGFDLVAANELKDRPNLVAIRPEQLERELTQWHFLGIQTVWVAETDGFPSFQPIHEAHEFERRKGGKAMPPSYDIGFIHNHNRRWKLPVEAKLLWSSEALAAYLGDVTVKYAGGVAAPWVGECGMVGYLLKGTADEVFAGLAARLGVALESVVRFEHRAHRTTVHARATGPRLRVHHMVMSCVPPGDKRAKRVRGRRRLKG